MQKRLKLADFGYSDYFEQYLMSLTNIQNLGTNGQEYITKRTHQVAQNLYSGKMQELLRTPKEQITGRIKEMTLRP